MGGDPDPGGSGFVRYIPDDKLCDRLIDSWLNLGKKAFHPGNVNVNSKPVALEGFIRQ
jgi:hypothetical protein